MGVVCDRCDSDLTEALCDGCAQEDLDNSTPVAVKKWLDRARVTPSGLTHAEVAVVERLIADLEAS